MKNPHQLALVTALILGSFVPAIQGQTRQPVDYVDPHIGSISYLLKSVSPTVQLPFGMLRMSPLTSPEISDSYLAEKIFGFPVDSVVLMPATGPVETDPEKIASLYDHDFETATPYAYSVTLEQTDTQVDFTVTESAAYFRIAYPKTTGRHMVMGVVNKGMLNADPAHSAVTGFEEIYGTRHFFYAESSRPFTVWGARQGSNAVPGLSAETGTNIGVVVNFPDAEANPFEWRVGISYISVEQAHRNLEEQIPAWNFAAVKNRARNVWNQALGKIAVVGGSEDEKKIFYTALARSLWGMADITEDGKYYSAYDKQLHSSDGHGTPIARNIPWSFCCHPAASSTWCAPTFACMSRVGGCRATRRWTAPATG
jgi:predicted alpha-1,2-mannosidase